jgi:hypothetical protein
VIRARIEGRAAPGPFVYKHLGSLATIGRKAAVVDFGAIKFSGALRWWFWGLVHVGFLVGMRNRISVMFDWFWSYLTFQSGTRLITGSVAGFLRTRVGNRPWRRGNRRVPRPRCKTLLVLRLSLTALVAAPQLLPSVPDPQRHDLRFALHSRARRAHVPHSSTDS